MLDFQKAWVRKGRTLGFTAQTGSERFRVEERWFEGTAIALYFLIDALNAFDLDLKKLVESLEESEPHCRFRGVPLKG